jgi:hypothetical protein
LNKKTCCGCGCIIILLVIAAVIAGGYYGVTFLHSAGKDVAAITFAKTIEAVTEKAFNLEDRKELIAAAEGVAEGIRSGKIGLIALFGEGTQQLEKGIYNKIILLAFKNHYMIGAEKGAEATFSVEGAKEVDRLLYGLIEKRISPEQVASVTMKLTEHFQEKMPSAEGKSELKISNRRVNQKLTQEEVLDCLKMITQICDLNNIEVPGEDYLPESKVKLELLQVFTSLQESGEKQK